MIVVPGFLALVGIIANMYTFIVFARLSQRLGNVTKMKPYYRVYYVSVVLAMLALVASFVDRGAAVAPAAVPFVSEIGWVIAAQYIALALANLLALAVTWRYWGWLLREK